MVRATAVAVTGSLEGVLMMASEREIAFQTIVCTLIPGRCLRSRARIVRRKREGVSCCQTGHRAAVTPTLPDNRSRWCDPQWHGSRAEPAYAKWIHTDAAAPNRRGQMLYASVRMHLEDGRS